MQNKHLFTAVSGDMKQYEEYFKKFDYEFFEVVEENDEESILLSLDDDRLIVFLRYLIRKFNGRIIITNDFNFLIYDNYLE